MSAVLADSKDYWDRHAQRDPLWAILSDTTKRDGRWDVEQFFQTGTSEIASLLYELDAQAILPRRGSALDFGCGVGRLTQALAPHFDRVAGVDVSPRMHELATRLNRHPQSVSYVCNQAADLRVFDDRSFDFIVSSIVLQHIQPDIACLYLREFFRVLTPAGIAVFQLPSHRRRWRSENRPLESIVNPMPDDAYRASLVAAGMPSEMSPGGQVTLQLQVTNVSRFDWIQREYGVFSVGNHWFDGAGQMLTRDDGRTRLPATLRAGETCHLSLTIGAPTNQGPYECEIDVVHEGIRWFHDQGSDVVRFAVRVGEGEVDFGPAVDRISRVHTPSPTVAAPDGRLVEALGVGSIQTNVDDPGEFPMYGVPVSSVVRLIADHEATLLHVEND